MPEIIEGLEGVSVHISDVRKSRPFYRDLLGLTELHYSEEAHRAVYAIPGTSVQLRMHRQGEDEGGREPGTVTGIIFTHHDPVAACAEIRKRGGTITDEPHEIHPPGMTAVLGVFADPDGNEFVIRSKPVMTK